MIQTSLPRQVVHGQQKTSSNTWFKNPCQCRSFLVNEIPQATHDSNVLRSFHDKKPQATHDTNIPAKAGRFWSTKNLKQLMIQKSLRSSHDKKPQATHDSNIPAKAGRFWSTKYLKQLMIQKPLPRQVVSGQQKTSSNSWFKNPCQNRSFPVNDKPQATHDSKIPAKAGRFWSTKYLKQPMRPPMIHTSSTNLSIEHLSNDPLVTLKNSR